MYPALFSIHWNWVIPWYSWEAEEWILLAVKASICLTSLHVKSGFASNAYYVYASARFDEVIEIITGNVGDSTEVTVQDLESTNYYKV